MSESATSKLPVAKYGPYAIVDSELKRIEERDQLFEYRLDGWSAWPLFRFAVVTRLAARDTISDRLSKRLYREVLTQQVPSAIHDICDWYRLPKASRYLALTSERHRTEVSHGQAVDIYFDELLLRLGSYCKVERLGSSEFHAVRRGALIPPSITTSIFDFGSELLSRFYPRPWISRIAKELHDLLVREVGLDSLSVPWLARRMNVFLWQKLMFKRLLQRIEPAYLLLANAYGNHSLVAAGKELGVPVIELQHGFLDRFHPGYSWSSFASRYRATLPIPGRILAYGSYWRNELLANGFWYEDEIVLTGSPRIDKYRSQIKASSSEERRLVLTTQGMQTTRLIKFLAKFLSAVSQRSLRIILTIKLHPSESDKSRYLDVLGHFTEVRVLRSTEGPNTFELIAESNYHLSVASTCHYEALGLGVPTIILPFWGHSAVTNLCATNCAFLAETPEELIRIVSLPSIVPVPDTVSREFFTPNALENMIRFFEGNKDHD